MKRRPGKSSKEDDLLLLGISYAAQPPAEQQNAFANAANYESAINQKQLHIIDCRSETAATGNKFMGKGTEDTTRFQTKDGSDRAKLHYANIGNIHDMRNGLRALTKALGASASNSDEFYATEAWLMHVSGVLAGSAKAASFIERGHAVLIHCRLVRQHR